MMDDGADVFGVVEGLDRSDEARGWLSLMYASVSKMIDQGMSVRSIEFAAREVARELGAREDS